MYNEKEKKKGVHIFSTFDGKFQYYGFGQLNFAHQEFNSEYVLYAFKITDENCGICMALSCTNLTFSWDFQ